MFPLLHSFTIFRNKITADCTQTFQNTSKLRRSKLVSYDLLDPLVCGGMNVQLRPRNFGRQLSFH
jgi:nitrogenase subunit NifH